MQSRAKSRVRSFSSSSFASTATASSHVQCFVPDLNRDHLSVSLPGQPRSSEPSVPCLTSTATLGGQSIGGQCSLPDLNRHHRRPVFPAGQPSVPCPTPTSRQNVRHVLSHMPEGMSERMSDRMSVDMSERMSNNIP